MNTNLTAAMLCPNCGKSLPSGALAGLCPACLLAQGTVTDTREGGSPHFQPPPLAEIAKLFPQLEILGLLGAGGMGAVYKARQPALDRFVALKILPATGSRGANFAERFNREARALARLSHPNIVAVHEFGQAGNLHFFIMEFVDGANLRQLARASRLAPREALQIIPQICDALQYAHDEGVVHRDIKPENVLVDRKGRVKIADFGLAKILGYNAEAARLTAEGQIMGTPHYMAPEQVERPLAVDHRADIYSLGVVFYEMLTGDLPLGKFPPPSRKVQVDVRLDEVVLRALENDPARRYQRASEVKSQVETIATSADSAAPAQSSAPQLGSRRYLHWAGFPVVVEYDGEREVSWNGTLSAVAAAFFCLFIGFVLVRFVTGASNHPGTLPICIMMAVLTVLAGVRRTLNQPSESELPRTPDGTVVLPPKRWWNPQYLAFVGITAFVLGWTLFTIHWLGPQIRKLTGKSVKVAQVAVRKPETGTLIAKLPERGTVELIAIGEPDSAPNQWWLPDGTPATNATYEVHNPSQFYNRGFISKDLLFRVTELPDGADGVYFEADPHSSYGSGGQVFQDGTLLARVVQTRFAWSPTTRKATIRAGLAIVPWRAVATHDLTRKSSIYTAKHGDPRWNVVIHSTADSQEGAQVTIVMMPEHRDWRTRVVAVDTNGVVHGYRGASGTPSEGSATWTYKFAGIPLAALKEFRVEVRPVHWIDFRNVSIEPRSPLPSPLPLKFSEVMERTFDELIDFDTGLTAEFPPGKPGEPAFAGIGENVLWAQENGFDAAAGAGELQILDATFAPLADADWDTLTAQQVVNRYYQGTFKPRTLKPTGSDVNGRTFAYRTRENGFGMIHLANLKDQKPGATVRIKQVIRAGTKPVVQARRDPKSGALIAKLANGGSVALVALKSNQDASQAWVQADGTPATGFECTVIFPQRLNLVEAKSFDLIFRLDKMPRPADLPVFEFAGAIRSAVGGKVEFRNQADEALLPVQVVWPLSANSASARVGIPLAEWHTIRSFEPFSRSFSKTRLGDDPSWEIDVHAAGVGTKGAQVTVVFGRDYPDWNLRVAAQRAGGAYLAGVLEAKVASGPTTTKTYVFPGLTLEEVQNFQVQAQPLEWVELGNLNLASAVQTAQE